MTERLPAGDARAESTQATGGETRLHDLTRAGLAAAAVRVVPTADAGMTAARTSASYGLMTSSRSVSVSDGAICSSRTHSPLFGRVYSMRLWWIARSAP
jgi:hypothetical protein